MNEEPSEAVRKVWDAMVLFGAMGPDEKDYDQEREALEVMDKYVSSLESFVRTFYELGRAGNVDELKTMVKTNYPSLARRR